MCHFGSLSAPLKQIVCWHAHLHLSQPVRHCYPYNISCRQVVTFAICQFWHNSNNRNTSKLALQYHLPICTCHMHRTETRSQGELVTALPWTTYANCCPAMVDTDAAWKACIHCYLQSGEAAEADVDCACLAILQSLLWSDLQAVILLGLLSIWLCFVCLQLLLQTWNGIVEVDNLICLCLGVCLQIWPANNTKLFCETCCGNWSYTDSSASAKGAQMPPVSLQGVW